jgi:hypothetical protein
VYVDPESREFGERAIEVANQEGVRYQLKELKWGDAPGGFFHPWI